MNMKSMKSGLKTTNSSYIQKKVTSCILLIETNGSLDVHYEKSDEYLNHMQYTMKFEFRQKCYKIKIL